MTVSRDFIDSCSPKPPAPPHPNARRPPCSLREARRDNEFPPPRNIAQGVDILAQDSLLLPYLDEAAGNLLRKTNSAAPRPRMSCAIAPRFLTWCLPASVIIRSSLYDVGDPQS